MEDLMKVVVRACLAALSVTLAAGPIMAAPGRQYFPREGKPFSLAVRVGDNVYVSGVVGTAADGSVPADFAVEATNTMNALAAELKLAGATMDDVYSCTIALTDMDKWAAFNNVYVKYFKPGRYPVRMSFGVTSLRGPSVEVQCEAYLGK
jgi:enamine deaminase RidA (YjgF/YER057c/UK114 family)